ncbi:uncharacterized protein [Leuresthes tenuis]|uniref:uncharacterized protein n=1 Tax=Leuresthes tenuis TaxID=355514 RepID=UPI003B5006D3
MSHVKPAEQPLTDTTADDKEEHADTPTDPSNIDHEAKVSTYTNVENSLPSTAESKATVEVPAAAEVEPKPQEESLNKTEPACAGADILPDKSSEEFPPQQAKEEIVASVEPVLESRTEEVAECEAQSADNAAVEQSVEPSAEVESGHTVEVPAAAKVEPKPQEESLNKTEPACATRLEDAGADILPDKSSEEFPPQQAKEEIVASVEPVLESRTEEVAECEAQSADNTAVEQSVEPSAEVESGHTVELNIEDAVKPVLPSDDEADQDNFNYKAINLTDALDVEVPTAEAVPKPVEDAAQSLPEEPKLNQQCDENTSEVIQKPAEELNSTEILYKSGDDSRACCFCNQIIDGNVKITLSEPPVNCHQECLKCGVCGKALGDLLISIYLHGNVIHCDSCFSKTLNV